MGISLKMAGGARRILAMVVASSLALAYLHGDGSSVVAAESNNDILAPVENADYAKNADQKYLVIASFPDAGQALLSVDTKINDALHLSGRVDLHQSVCFVKTRAPGLRWRVIIPADKFLEVGLDGVRFLGQLGFKVFALDIRAGIVKCDRGRVVDPAPKAGKHPTIKAAQYQQKAGTYGAVKHNKRLLQKSATSGLPGDVWGAPVSFKRTGDKGETSNGKLRTTREAKPDGIVAAGMLVSDALAVSDEGVSGDPLTPRKQPDLGAGDAVGLGVLDGGNDRRDVKYPGDTDVHLTMDVALSRHSTSLTFDEPLPSAVDASLGVALGRESEVRKDDGFRPSRWRLSDSQSAFTAGDHPLAFVVGGESESGGICRQIVSVPSERLVPTYSADYLYMTPDGTQCALMYVVNLNKGSSL